MLSKSFSGRTVFISGASRGIGKAIALKLARHGANIVVAAKTATKHPKLPGTIYTAVDEIEEAGGKGLACVMDIREEADVENAVKKAVESFGGIDVLINNASAISVTGTLETSMKKFDLMHSINTRGTFMLSQKCIPYLKKGENPHILNISPPLLMEPHCFSNHVAYTMAKYGMSMCVLGMSRELKPFGIGVNALWPQTAIWTAAMKLLGASKEICRKPDIVADAAYAILCRSGRQFSGNFVTDEETLKQEGVKDFEKYSYKSGSQLLPDFFLPGVKYEDFFSYKNGIHVPITNTTDFHGNDNDLGEKNEKNLENVVNGGDKSEEFNISDELMKTIFLNIKSVLSKRLVDDLHAVFQFKFKDDVEIPFFFIDVKNGCGRISSGISEDMDVAFELDKSTFINIFQGKLSPLKAFFNHDLQVRGDVAKAFLLRDVVKRLQKC